MYKPVLCSQQKNDIKKKLIQSGMSYHEADSYIQFMELNLSGTGHSVASVNVTEKEPITDKWTEEMFFEDLEE